MNKLKLIMLILILILITTITVLVTSKNSNLHKPVMITDAKYDYNIVKKEISNVDTKMHNVQVVTTQQNIQVTPQTSITKQQTKINFEQTPVSDIKTKIIPQKTNTVEQKIKTSSVNVQTTPTKVDPSTNIIKQEVPKVVVEQTTNQSINKTEPKAVQKQEIPDTDSSKPAKKVLTESEEIIAWNKWRSEIQNQVMRDTKISAPLGTSFRFSFTVDRFGCMSNIKVWSTNPVYTDLAVRVIKPVLSSYHKTPILNFPEGTKRVITNVDGGFVISTSTEYSTPSDYSDYEKIKRTQYK